MIQITQPTEKWQPAYDHHPDEAYPPESLEDRTGTAVEIPDGGIELKIEYVKSVNQHDNLAYDEVIIDRL